MEVYTQENIKKMSEVGRKILNEIRVDYNKKAESEASSSAALKKNEEFCKSKIAEAEKAENDLKEMTSRYNSEHSRAVRLETELDRIKNTLRSIVK